MQRKTRIKQVLEENVCQESIISKIFKGITKDVQEEEIRMSVNFPFFECISEKLRLILRSNKIRSTFYTESTLRELLCKPKATEDKNKIIVEINCSNREAVYFAKYKGI